MIIEREQIDEYLKTTNLLLFIEDVKVESINESFIHIGIPREIICIKYEGIKFNYRVLIYDKEKRVLYLDMEEDLKIELKDEEFLKIEEINGVLYITKHTFTDELLNSDGVQYPIFETSIKQSYDGSVLVNIYMRCYIDQVDLISVHTEVYKDFNLALNETAYIKSLLEQNRSTLMKLQQLCDEQVETSILIDGVLYKFNCILDGHIVVNELSEFYSIRNKCIRLHKLLNKQFTIISNGEYIAYDENVYKNNQICEDLTIPNKFKGSYFESIYKFYDTITHNAQLEDESLNCIKNDIKDNYFKLSEKERNSTFSNIIKNSIVFIENNKAIKFNEENIKYIDSVMEEI